MFGIKKTAEPKPTKAEKLAKKQEARKLARMDYVRVCDKCGTQRFLPKAFALELAPSQKQIDSVDRSVARGTGFQKERHIARTLESSNLHAKQDRVLANAMCPNCGSSEFTQYAPGQEIPAND